MIFVRVKTVTAALAVIFLLLSFGCAGRPVRHLSSDACLLLPEKTTREEVLSYLGLPDEQVTLEDGREEWTYYQSRKSLWRKAPYVGPFLGSEEYDVLKVTLAGDLVTACVYRNLTDEEFRQGEADQ